MARTQQTGRPSEARTRLLNTALKIFYAEGIHSVGIDRIVEEAQVTRATLYRHFLGKEELVVAYLNEADAAMRAQAEQAAARGHSPADTVRELSRAIAGGIRSPEFRGCAFLNAAAEYPDPEHPVHRAVLAHREWFQTTVTELFTQIRAASAEPAARHFVMLRDGAMASGCLSDAEVVCETFLRGVEGLLQAQIAPETAETGTRAG
ncbi:TetR/AcrR family transcriptional regulator [Lentzea flava]|uniref:TetR family transcriptional regulator n=1 Tax=Lentzea flava TaxID=103732 RepID=A0ABQ2UAL9_9PSEU|nr:TetR/AcrR family transcriptional regulator [Lentzea flava]MCP2196557.1 transcriptional regulator, TetR family [Lentzea flava]GGU17132.1 TetR family transcriptional regulator [Lentzea flava]